MSKEKIFIDLSHPLTGTLDSDASLLQQDAEQQIKDLLTKFNAQAKQCH